MRRSLISLALLLAAGATAARAQDAANAARVAADLRSNTTAAAAVAWYAVPALSDVQRLPDTFPWDGRAGGEVRLLAARNEFEPASFVLFPFADQAEVTLTPTALQGPDGASFPAASLALKVVKVWYQNGNGWFSYFADPGLKLVPELLLNDESLIKVDTAARANYARLDEPAGSRYVWISPPRRIDSSYDEHSYKEFQTFRPLAIPFADAAALRPVALQAGRFKQFWLTARVPKDAKPGLYKGRIAVTAAGKKLAEIPLALRILPFELPEPKTYADLNREFLVTLYSCPSVSSLMEANGANEALAEKQLLAMMKNMRDHNLMHPMMRTPRGEPAKRHLELMKEAGLKTRPIVGNFAAHLANSGTLGFDQLMRAKQDAEGWRAFFLKNLGHTDVFLQSGDEPGAAWVALMRPAWKLYHENGLKIFTAGHGGMFVTGGYVYDMHPCAAFPEEAETAKPWNDVGRAYIGFYAGQHNGSENPAFVRRQHGLLGYLSGFSMVCNYEFALGPWNDLAYDLYKPMVVAYATHDGLADTLAWEGFREGIDDIRYATKLLQLAQQAIDSGNLDRSDTGRKVRQWFALLDGQGADLNAVRAEMIEQIMTLSAMQ
jgi:hypothetical protein